MRGYGRLMAPYERRRRRIRSAPEHGAGSPPDDTAQADAGPDDMSDGVAATAGDAAPAADSGTASGTAARARAAAPERGPSTAAPTPTAMPSPATVHPVSPAAVRPLSPAAVRPTSPAGGRPAPGGRPADRPTSGAGPRGGQVRPGGGPGGEEPHGERGLRGLVGSGSSQVGVGAALRARDAARPTEEHLAEAAERLVIVRRNWVPREDLPRNR